MVQGRAAGNGNFDIDAITRLANADANAPAVIDQPFIDPVADAFAADVDDMVDELRFNPSSNLAEEAQQIMNSPLATRLGAGVMADLRAAVQLQEEKGANGADAFMRGDRVWEEREKREEKERKEQAKIADMADDANNSQLSTTPDRFGNSQQDYADLNSELKTKDGQERFMSFLRMMYPNMTDAQIKERMLDVQAVAAVEDGTASEAQRKRVESKTPEEVAGLKGDVAQYREATLGHGNDPLVADRVGAQAVELSANTIAETTTVAARQDVLSGGEPVSAKAVLRTSVSTEMDGRSEFSTAPSLRDHHRASLAATTPLDQPAPQVIASAAPIAPSTVANSGFDV